MRTLGVDPAISSPTGIALVEDGALVDWLALLVNHADDLDRRIAGLAKAVAVQAQGARVDVVAVEQPYVPTWERGAKLNRKASDAMELTKLTQAIAVEVARVLPEARIVMVDPAEGFRALTGSAKGDKSGHVRMANARRGRCAAFTENDHHAADAFGVALAGEARARFGEVIVP